jgi:hypothetical protein
MNGISFIFPLARAFLLKHSLEDGNKKDRKRLI